MDEQDGYDFLYKVLLIGDSAVGKTSLIQRFTRNDFTFEQQPTIGVEFSTRTVSVNGKVVKAQIWDTAGQERYRAITSAYYRGAVGAMLVFDLTKQSTFDNLKKWYKELREHSDENIMLILIGNKCDLDSQRVISKDQAASFAEEYGMAYLETSALETINVDKSFMQLVQYIYDQGTGDKTLIGEKTVRKIGGKQITSHQQAGAGQNKRLADGKKDDKKKSTSCC